MYLKADDVEVIDPNWAYASNHWTLSYKDGSTKNGK